MPCTLVPPALEGRQLLLQEPLAVPLEEERWVAVQKLLEAGNECRRLERWTFAERFLGDKARPLNEGGQADAMRDGRRRRAGVVRRRASGHASESSTPTRAKTTERHAVQILSLLAKNTEFDTTPTRITAANTSVLRI